VSRPLLESLASQTAASNTDSLVAQVYDQYLNFVVTEENLFSCDLHGVYNTLNNPTIADTVIEDTINRIVSSLFSVTVTLGIHLGLYLANFNRRYADYTMSKRKCCRNDFSTVGSKVARLLCQFACTVKLCILDVLSRQTW